MLYTICYILYVIYYILYYILYYVGVDVQEISPQEVKKLFPLCEVDDVIAGFYVKGMRCLTVCIYSVIIYVCIIQQYIYIYCILSQMMVG